MAKRPRIEPRQEPVLDPGYDVSRAAFCPAGYESTCGGMVKNACIMCDSMCRFLE